MLAEYQVVRERPNRKYKNDYIITNNCVYLHIYGGKHFAFLMLEKDDFKRVSERMWGLMEVGKKGYGKIVPYTVENRTSIPLGRWLLNVTQKGMRVEHIDRNNHNFLHSNIYVIRKNDPKKQIPINKHNLPIGVSPISHNNGKVTGYLVSYRNKETNKLVYNYFSASEYGNLGNALSCAEKFRLKLQNAA